VGAASGYWSCASESSVGDRQWIALGVDCVRIRSSADTGVEVVDGPDVVGAESEVEDVDVLGDSLGPGRLRDRRRPVLDVPAQDDLRGRLAVPLRQPDDDGMRERVPDSIRVRGPVAIHAAERRPGLAGNAEASVSIPQPGLHVERMQLDLIDGRHDIGLCDEIGELLLIEVADTY